MIKLRYYSEFRDRLDARYRIEIHQHNEGVEWTPREVVLSDTPLDIEWEDVDKIEPVQGSSATLNLISMSDREFADLYTIEPGAIRLDVWRNDALYWSGMLDPEIFEEPYSYRDRYVTSVTFSDLGILDRKDWEGRGIHSLRGVIDTCIAASGIRYTELVQYISTRIVGSADPLPLDELFCVGDNFYDEDGEAMTVREVLEEVLRPFALRLVQKSGRIWLYDLNAVHAHAARRVVWTGADASLEADVVYNNVKVTFSPYADGALVDGALDHDRVLQDQPEGTSGELIYTNRAEGAPDGFRIVRGTKSEQTGNLTLKNGAVPFRIDPEYSGSKEAGVMWGYRPGDIWRGNSAFYPYDEAERFIGKPIISTPLCYIGAIEHPHKWQLKLDLSVMFDVRYNPFEQDEQENERGNWGHLQNWCNYGYIPIALTLCDADGKVLYCYSNSAAKYSNSYAHKNCQWIEEPGVDIANPSRLRAWLCYYDNNRTNRSGFGGWASNRPIIGWYSGDFPSRFKALGTGEYIDLPPKSGFLQLHIYSGVEQYDNNADNRLRDIYREIRWIMYKDPKIEIVKANGRNIDKQDIEDTAWINKSAKEDLTIDTIIGTMSDPVPSARGLLSGSQVRTYTKFTRAGHTDRLERLLIGTVYSQYATRKHILSGTVELIPEFGVLTDGSEPGQYLLLGEVQHLREAMSEIKMVQFDADNYDAIEYKYE